MREGTRRKKKRILLCNVLRNPLHKIASVSKANPVKKKIQDPNLERSSKSLEGSRVALPRGSRKEKIQDPNLERSSKSLEGSRVAPTARAGPNEMHAFDWTVLDLSRIVQSIAPNGFYGAHGESTWRGVNIPGPDNPRHFPTSSSTRPASPASVLPIDGPFAGVHYPALPFAMTVPLRVGDRVAMPRCCFRTSRRQPDGSFRCLRSGAAAIDESSVCTRHRALAQRYSDAGLNWCFTGRRSSLAGPRRSPDGRFHVAAHARDRTFYLADAAANPGDLQLRAVIFFWKNEITANDPLDLHLFESGTTCPICLDETDPAETLEPHVKLGCGHGMHLDCMYELVKANLQSLDEMDEIPCPFCRANILPDIVKCRYHLLDRRVVAYCDGSVAQLVRGAHSALEMEVAVMTNASNELRLCRSDQAENIVTNWTALGIEDMPDPTDKIMDLIGPVTPRPASRVTAPTSPFVTPPPVVINLADSPPSPPARARRVRRRLDQDWLPPPTFPAAPDPRVVSVPTGELTHVLESQRLTEASIGINLAEIESRVRNGEHVIVNSGTNRTDTVRYTVTVVQTHVGTRTLTVNVQLV